MKAIFVLLISLFLHIVDDFYLQGPLAKMKQKKWWKKNVKVYSLYQMYKNDYIIALILHAFSWTFCVMSPYMVIMFYKNYFGKSEVFLYLMLFVIHSFIHGYIDCMKCNDERINLIQDQIIHIAQIITIWVCMLIAHIATMTR